MIRKTKHKYINALICLTTRTSGGHLKIADSIRMGFNKDGKFLD
jgi:hypothetical protein